MKNRTRPIRMNVYFTREELAALQAKADEAGLPKGEFIRRLIAGKEIKAVPPEEARDLLRTLYTAEFETRRVLRIADRTKMVDADQMRKALVQVHLAAQAIINFYNTGE